MINFWKYYEKLGFSFKNEVINNLVITRQRRNFTEMVQHPRIKGEKYDKAFLVQVLKICLAKVQI